MKKQNTSNRNFPIPVPSAYATWSEARKAYYDNWLYEKLLARIGVKPEAKK